MNKDMEQLIRQRSMQKLDLKNVTPEQVAYAILDRALLWNEYEHSRYGRRLWVTIKAWKWKALITALIVFNLVVLKLTHVLLWSWLAVSSPALAMLGLGLTAFVVYGIVLLIEPEIIRNYRKHEYSVRQFRDQLIDKNGT